MKKRLLLLLTIMYAVAMMATEVTWTARSLGYTDGQELASFSIDPNISVTTANCATAAKYINPAWYFYKNGSFTISAVSGYVITDIAFTFQPNYTGIFSVDTGTWLSPNWSGSAVSITFSQDADGATARIQAITVTYSTSETLHSITIDDNIQNGTISTDISSATSGTTVSLTAVPDEGYMFSSWNVMANDAPITVENNSFTMPDDDVYVSATFAPVTYEIVAFVAENNGIYYAADVNVGNKREVVMGYNKVVYPDVFVKNSIAWAVDCISDDLYSISPLSDMAKHLRAYHATKNLSLLSSVTAWKKREDNTFWIPNSDLSKDFYRAIAYEAGATVPFVAATQSNLDGNNYSIARAFSIAKGDVIEVSSAQYATYFNADQAFIMPFGLEGMVVSSLSGEMLALHVAYHEGDAVPAGEPLILHATEVLPDGGRRFGLEYTNTTNESLKSEGSNLLSGTSSSTELTTGGDIFYRLSVHEGQVGFYYGAEGGAAFRPGAHKAYLAINSTAQHAPASFLINAESDELTAVEDVNTQDNPDKFVENGCLFIRKNGHVYAPTGLLIQ